MLVGRLQFSMMTYNVGNEDDHFIQAHIHTQMGEQHVSHAIAEREARIAIQLKKDSRERLLSEASQSQRLETIRGIFNRTKPDIICLQEVISDNAYREMLGLLPEYEAHSQTRPSRSNHDSERTRESVVAWNPAVFTQLKQLNVSYETSQNLPIPIKRRNPNTIVVLEHHATKKIIAICSAHLAGFNLAENLQQHAKRGNLQLCHDLDVLHREAADLYIYAGDLNVTPRRHQNRLHILENFGYSLDRFHIKTAYDLSLRAYEDSSNQEGALPPPRRVKLDHIAIKGIGPSAPVITPHEEQFSLDPLSEEFIASDHTPLMCWIKA